MKRSTSQAAAVLEASAGQRTRSVEIQACVDPTAQFPQWDTMGYAWMSRADLGAEERFRMDQETAYEDSRWVLPYRADMDPELVDVPAFRRLVYEGRTYEIRSARPSGWKRHIELTTLARVG